MLFLFISSILFQGASLQCSQPICWLGFEQGLEQDEEVWKPRAIYSVFVLSHWHKTLFIVSPAVEAKPGDHSSLDLKLALFLGFLNVDHMCVPATRQRVVAACTRGAQTLSAHECTHEAPDETLPQMLNKAARKRELCVCVATLERKGSQEKSWTKIFHCNFSSQFSFAPSSIFCLGLACWKTMIIFIFLLH